ncbi:MAG TPA: hypothetical protein PKX94_08195, partial [Opitutales bacterium]|nr:hypothetical protein [Opitutales bacterium]
MQRLGVEIAALLTFPFGLTQSGREIVFIFGQRKAVSRSGAQRNGVNTTGWLDFLCLFVRNQ